MDGNTDLSSCCAEMQRVVQREQGTVNREQEKPRTEHYNQDKRYVPATKQSPESPKVLYRGRHQFPHDVIGNSCGGALKDLLRFAGAGAVQ